LDLFTVFSDGRIRFESEIFVGEVGTGGSAVGGGCWSKMAAGCREAMPGKGARYFPTSLLRSSRPKGGQHDASTEKDGRDGRSGVVWWQRSAVAGGSKKEDENSEKNERNYPRHVTHEE
jgi:hypothetical protein